MSPERKSLYNVGMVLTGLGFLLFLSTFFSFASTMGHVNPGDGPSEMGSIFGRAVGGMFLIVVGQVFRTLGMRGLAGSGAILDPEQARRDLEPWSRMAGGVVQDALSETSLPSLDGPVVKVRCLECRALNDETNKFCGECGQPL